VDDESRLIIVEGLADGAMRLIHEVISHKDTIGETVKSVPRLVLMNSSVRFTKRAYTSFDVDLKMIRLRNLLREIVTTPAIYNRGKISEECFETLNRMATIRDGRTLSIRDLKIRELFPSVVGLLEVENKYVTFSLSLSLYSIQKHKNTQTTQIRRNSVTVRYGRTTPQEKNKISSHKTNVRFDEYNAR